PWSPLHIPLAVLALVAMLSALLGAYPLLGIKAWLVTAGYAAFGYLYFVSSDCTPERAARWSLMIVISGAFWGFYGSTRWIFLGLTPQNAFGSARPFFVDHGAYSAFLAMTLPIAVLRTMEGHGRARLAYGIATSLIGLGVLLSFTRAAWLSIAIVVPMVLLLWRGRRGIRNLLAPAILVLFAACILGGTGVVDRITRHAESIVATENVSNVERVNRWIAAIEMVRDRPWLGVGYDAFGQSYPRYRRKLIVTELAYQRMGPHSEPLRILSETGWLGMAA